MDNPNQLPHQPSERQSDQDADEFYEAMPAAHQTPYQYRQEGWDDSSDDGKRVAIITLIVVAVIAIAVAMLFVQGLLLAQETFSPLVSR